MVTLFPGHHCEEKRLDDMKKQHNNDACLVAVPSSGFPGERFIVQSSAEIRLRNVERWRRGSMARAQRAQVRGNAERALHSHKPEELARVAREAVALAQAGAIQHRNWGKGKVTA